MTEYLSAVKNAGEAEPRKGQEGVFSVRGFFVQGGTVYYDSKRGPLKLCEMCLKPEGGYVVTFQIPDGRKIQQSFRAASGILSDEELRSLTEDVPFAEGDSLEVFLKEAAHVMNAIGNDGTDFGCLEYRARLVYLFRAFYFLGVLRGGEAYRWSLASETEEANNEDAAAFQLDAACADLFVSELACASPDKLRPIYELLKL